MRQSRGLSFGQTTSIERDEQMKRRAHILSGSCAVLLLATKALWADALDEWQWRNPLPQGNSVRGLAWGNGVLAAVGDLGTVMTSHDGTNWVRRHSGTSWNLNAGAPHSCHRRSEEHA